MMHGQKNMKLQIAVQHNIHVFFSPTLRATCSCRHPPSPAIKVRNIKLWVFMR